MICFDNLRHFNAGDHADGKIKQKEAHPEPGMVIVYLLPGLQPERFQHNEKKTQADGEDRPQNMKHRGNAKLKTGQKQVVVQQVHGLSSDVWFHP